MRAGGGGGKLFFGCLGSAWSTFKRSYTAVVVDVLILVERSRGARLQPPASKTYFREICGRRIG